MFQEFLKRDNFVARFTGNSDVNSSRISVLA
jgi:hypothetical protein